MSNIILGGGTSGSGSVTLQAPNTNSNQTVNIPDRAGNLMMDGPAFCVYPSASSTNISSSTTTKMVLDAELFDTNNNFASNRFTPTVAGYYQINATVNTGSGSAYWSYLIISKNGTALVQSTPVFQSAGMQNYCNQISQLIYMNGTTDYLEFYVNVYIASGTPSYAGSTLGSIVTGYLARAA